MKEGKYPDIDIDAPMSEAARWLIEERNRIVEITARAFEIAAGLAEPKLDLPGDGQLILNTGSLTAQERVGAELQLFYRGGPLIGKVPDAREVSGATTRFQG